jgi:hypothetical protein
MRAALVSFVFLVLLACAPAASAAPRYAAPAGSGTECSEGKPCSLAEAIEKAKANDEVIVTAGEYTPSSSITLKFEAAGAYIHGDFRGPRPTITRSSPGYALALGAPKSRLAYLDVSNAAESAAGVVCTAEAAIERVKLAVKGKYAAALQQLESCSIRDSLLRANGESSTAITSTGSVGTAAGAVRNVTAFATGPKSVALRSSAGPMFGIPHLAVVRNSILSGDEYDLHSTAGLSAGNIDVAYSNFDVAKQEPGTTLIQGPGNQSATPLFLDAGAGDYREASGSPTINAGVNEELGAADFDGNPRLVGPAPDIGAFEFVPPPPPPPPLAPTVPPGEIQSLTVAPKVFRTANVGGAIVSARTKAKAPVAATVSYELSAAPATVAFSVERKLSGRRVGRKCVQKTKANAAKKKCPLYKPVRGGFSHAGAVGTNRFTFSGRLDKALAPGAYRLTGRTAASARSTVFRIVK